MAQIRTVEEFSHLSFDFIVIGLYLLISMSIQSLTNSKEEAQLV